MKKMKRIASVTLLACAMGLLSACPDSKLPNPAPKVPEPKAVGAQPKPADNASRQAGAFDAVRGATLRQA